MFKLFCLIFIRLLPGCTDSGPSPDKPTYPNAHLLISTGELAKRLDDFVVIDTRPADKYVAGHIPGAINLERRSFVIWEGSTTKGMLLPYDQLAAVLGEKGITRETSIVVYDDVPVSRGSAGWFFWMLEVLGNQNIRLLNGGWDTWRNEGRTVQTSPNTLTPTEFNPSINPDILVDRNYIATNLDNKDVVLVDTRTFEEYIGWILHAEARGGHIPGAVHLPYKSVFDTNNQVLDYEKLHELLEVEGLSAKKQIIGYSTAGVRSGFLYFLGRLMGFDRIANYDGSIWNWAAGDTSTYPMDKMKNHQALVYPAWVESLIKGEKPPTYSGNGYAVLFTSWEARYKENRTDYIGTPYETGHIPGALFMDTYSIENGPNSEFGDGYENAFEANVKPIGELQKFFGDLGIRKDMTVVVYAHDEISMMTAGRVAWALILAGVNDVRILNGNYSAWIEYGGVIETKPNSLPAVDFGDDPGNLQWLATTQEVAAVVSGDDTEAVIADDRSWDEFAGSSNSYYHYFHELGRIPSARWIGDWDTLTSPDHQSVRVHPEVITDWTRLGFSSEKKMLFYCGTGWRSGLYTFYAYLLGWPAANYDGGWFAWSTGDHPREIGHPEILLHAGDLKELIDKKNGGKPLVIVETGWGPAGESYAGGHIPGAIWVNTDEIEYDCFNARNDWPVDAGEPACFDRSTNPEEDAAKGLGPDDTLPRNWWNLYPDHHLLSAIAYMGIHKDTTVVVTADNPSAAARLAWTLLYSGVSDVRLLDGGKQAWKAAGFQLQTTGNQRTPIDCFDPDNPNRTQVIHPEYKVDIPFVRKVVNGEVPNAALVDIRTWDEYIGKSTPYSYIPTSGRIPDAIWGLAGSESSGMEDYLNQDGTFRSPSDIYTFWVSQGITSDKYLSFYCGTAWRSSLTWLYAYLIGYPRISNFDSSWFEWSMGEGSAYNGDDPVLNPIVDDYPDLP